MTNKLPEPQLEVVEQEKPKSDEEKCQELLQRMNIILEKINKRKKNSQKE